MVARVAFDPLHNPNAFHSGSGLRMCGSGSRSGRKVEFPQVAFDALHNPHVFASMEGSGFKAAGFRIK